jgi:hypothetical protein
MADVGGLKGFVGALLRPQVRRTCDECTSTWNVPRYFTRVNLPFFGGAARGRARLGHVNAVIAQRAPLNDLAERDRRCPDCGSQRFHQKRVWSE